MQLTESKPKTSEESTKSPPKRTKSHGLSTLKRAVKELGSRVVDGRTTMGKALQAWRAELVEDLGGASSISTQQAALIDIAVKTKLMLNSVDAYLLNQPSLVNKSKRSLYPIVLQRQQLADGLARYLSQLGLERKQKATMNLADYLKKAGNE